MRRTDVFALTDIVVIHGWRRSVIAFEHVGERCRLLAASVSLWSPPSAATSRILNQVVDALGDAKDQFSKMRLGRCRTPRDFADASGGCVEIAGGAYREICYIPAWNSLFGSGVRAAAALVGLSSEVTLHSYVNDAELQDLEPLRRNGVKVHQYARAGSIVFVYFHSLSRPYIQPTPQQLQKEADLRIEGEVVLRFGFLEGDAIVNAEQAVYDPQTSHAPALFKSNGSVAKRLAIVLNEAELRALSGEKDLSDGAEMLMRVDDAQIVIAKMGVKGSTVFERGGKRTHVPAYFSDRVFKIGTGDVFSAGFTHHWAEQGLDAATAADKASRMVAAYCNSGRLPVPAETENPLPLEYRRQGVVQLEGPINTIGRRYTMEEARFVLQDLGVTVSCPALGDEGIVKPSSILVILDNFDVQTLRRIQDDEADGIPIVALVQTVPEEAGKLSTAPGVRPTNDFASAMYFAAWAAMSAPVSTNSDLNGSNE
jgi:hypothetical protein